MELFLNGMDNSGENMSLFNLPPKRLESISIQMLQQEHLKIVSRVLSPCRNCIRDRLAGALRQILLISLNEKHSNICFALKY